MKAVVLCTAAALVSGVELCAETPTFGRDIAPLIYSHCSSCHRPGQAGPFSLLSYSDVKKHARQIVKVTETRYMPPWLAQGRLGEFQGDGRLTANEIRLIRDWVEAGALEGDARLEPTPPKFADGWQLGTPDLVLQAAKPFRVARTGSDQFWNFIYKPQLASTRFVRAIEIRPGTQNVHHANLVVDRAGACNRLEKVPGGGFAGMDFTVDRNPFDPDSHFLFWKPGSQAREEPDGLSWRLDPGNELILNTHLQASGKEEEVQPVIGLYFTDKAPTKFPVLVELQNDEALNIPPGAQDFVISDDFTLPVDVDVLAIYPHAHYLGRRVEAFAKLPDGSRKELIHISDWNLAWQAVYRYREPVFLPHGSVVSMRFHYDNSTQNVRNSNAPPKRVQAGNSASDEMGHLWLQLLPRGRGDQRRRIQQAMAEHRLSRNPNDFSAYLNLGAIRLSRLDAQGAEAMLRKAIQIDATQPEAHNMLGVALRLLGRTNEATEQFALAVKVDPEYVDGRYNLAKAMLARGEYDKALEHLRVVAAAFPEVRQIQDELRQVEERGTGRNDK